MSYFSSLGEFASDVEAFDYDISEIHFLDGPSGSLAVALNGATGGLMSFDVLDDGTFDFITARSFRSGSRDFQTVQTAVVTVYGNDFVVTGAAPDGTFYGYLVGDDGSISKLKELPATSGASGDIIALVPLENDGNVAQIITFTDEGHVQIRSMTSVGESLEGAQTIDLFQADIAHLEVVQNGSETFILTTEHLTGDVVSYSYDASTQTTEEVGRSGASVGVGMGTPTDFTTITVGDVTYVVAASSTSSSLSVFEVKPDGSLRATDHVLDTLYTLFGRANMVESFEANGNSFIAVSGGDAGLSLFTVIPGGQLVLVENFNSSNDTPLMNLSSISVTQDGDTVSLHLTSETRAGITSLSFDVGSWSAPQYGDNSDSSLTGSGGDDVLVGGAGDELLHGNAGDDILSDGRGTDRLYGGSGADVFVMTSDDVMDTIEDFEAGKDRVDLSDYSMLYSPDQLTYSNLSGGLSLWFGNERLDILSNTGYELTIAQIFGMHFINPDRPFLANVGEIFGSSDDDVIFGSKLSELIQGMHGDDNISGGEGGDTILGGDGDDILCGEDGADEIYGGTGNDTVDGGNGQDLVYLGDGSDSFLDSDQTGTDGKDTVYGGSGNDRIAGGGGDDTFYGGSGSDYLYGGADNDTLDGGDGWDRLYGQDGNDVMYGGEGTDFLYGGTGNDIMHGEEGNDTMNGGDGNDILRGGLGNDTIDGGNDRDSMSGDAGNDTLSGGSGGDRIWGGTGNDVLNGNDGWDRLFGQEGDDTLNGDAGNDYLYGGAGMDVISGGTDNDIISGNEDADALYGDDGADRVYGGDGGDHIDGGAHRDRLYGQDGDDTIIGGDGSDYLYGGNGNDDLNGGGGVDVLSGNSGADRFIFEQGFGRDAVQDFDVTEDQVVFDIDGMSVDDLALSEASGTLSFTYESNGRLDTVTFKGLSLSDFDDMDIVFV
ncbi:calcium-binding protein [Pacificibacter marinus]|uniref:Bifunctional hemolysin/adenylate cyclase n=1 Tax=Pacificibacter marinus TaxID=658057 RepID=A0A1Y5S540_9RHOB|nr:calcium-binding protein [Pacificibacter marinus]SEK94209.1 Ca2+-binding protein, RTX toxin-related [Pacificibacter marinus]SLN30010.1 Bifunctional hemolysin/adenylate cyclase precursor [Pacificibacter marinus]